MEDDKMIVVEVEFEAHFRSPDVNIGGVGGFDMTHVVSTAKGSRFIEVFEDENVKNRLESLLRNNGVDLIEARILKIS